MSARLYCGDVRDVLAELPEQSVRCCVTSPPYWGLRDYGHAGQIGLEPTPEAYVADLVDVFRRVRRVLTDDGTLWLNLGDSYAGGGGFSPDAPSNLAGAKQTTQRGAKSGGLPIGNGLKSKDLVGIPWRVARALQEPYYTGKIRSELDRVWLAAIIDGEGCMFIHRRKAGQNNGQGYRRKNDSFGAGLEVSNTNPGIVERCIEITGMGSVCQQEGGTFGRKQTIYRWNMRSNQCRDVIQEVYPYLVAKQHEARLVLSCPSSGPDAVKAWQSVKNLHQGDDAVIDFKPPQSLHEPGYYLRSDIVWSKLNPMPESVTDRPTKAHEYVFLLSKSERYYYDLESIREPVSPNWSPNGAPQVKEMGNQAANGNRPQRRLKYTEPKGANARTVWEIATKPYPMAHFATFPPELAKRCIAAGSAPGDTVLDPFGGSGTTASVATGMGRASIYIDLNPDYLRLAEHRIGPMLCEVVV